jgi:N-acetylated-alpha-linked acidic dipeptidase
VGKRARGSLIVIALVAVVAALVAAGIGVRHRERDVPFGFAPASAARQLALERRFLALPDPARLRDTHRLLTRDPHPAGSARDRELAEWTAERFRAAGMHDVAIVTHHVLLPSAREVTVEMLEPRRWRASMLEPGVAGDPDTGRDISGTGVPSLAYSAAGEVTAPVVYAGTGSPADYDWLAARGIDVRGRIVIVRHSLPYSYRGFKAFTAEQRGAAGILMYSDPAADGSGTGTPYPDGPWGPDTRIERGSIAYDFLVPGDPLTPGWPSLPGARRVAPANAVSLPAIVGAPLSAVDARPILEALGGTPAPRDWHTGLARTAHVGPGPAQVRLTVRTDDAVRPIWTVTGVIPGSESRDEYVIVGNHRDAWVYGGADPSSGSAALMELARAFGELGRLGWRPRRSILFASWDAEELALTSSTEWGEQHEAWVRDRAVAYLNVDSAASGSRFVAAAVPSLARLLAEVAQAVRDPSARVPVAAVARQRHAGERGSPPRADDDTFIDARPGGGSDYTVFLNFLGVPIADLAFDGPLAVYHSKYDTHAWVARFGDPGFRYHAALVQLWGLAALRLAEADTLPLDPSASAARIAEFVAEIERRVPPAPGGTPPVLAEVRAAADALAREALAFEARRRRALEAGDDDALRRINARLLGFEHTFIDPEGLPGRPWYRHLIHAPAFSYAPTVLPGLAAAIDAKDDRMLAAQSRRLAAALRRAAEHLREH